MDQSERPSWASRIGILAATIFLWAVTSGLSFWEIVLVREIALRVLPHFGIAYSFFGPTYSQVQLAGIGQALSIVTVSMMGIAALVVSIGFGDYHLQNMGRPGSWRIFVVTLYIEISILVLVYLVR